jgi:UDP-glucose 4-epimerase
MKILITGASGFIGTNYINYNKVHEIESICLIKSTLTSLDFSNNDVIVHLSALVHQMGGVSDADYFKINSDLAFETALKAKKEGIKQFVFISTIKVFGESTTGKIPFDENSECHPEDSYGKSKLEAEKRIAALEDDDFKVVIIRSPLVYGPGVKANMFNLIKLVDKSLILPFGNINNKRSFVYIENLIALINIVISSEASGIYIAGDSESLSTTELVIAIAKALNKKRLLFSFPLVFKKIIAIVLPLHYDRLWGSLEVSASQGWSSIGFIPPVSFEDGIADMVKWYLSIKNIKGN